MGRKVRLRATQGATEANWSGSDKPYLVNPGTGMVMVDEEAVGPLVEKGGFVVANPEQPHDDEEEHEMVRMKHRSDPTASVSHGGETYDPDADGMILVPSHAVEHLEPHGFVPFTDEKAQKAQREELAKKEKEQAAEKEKAEQQAAKDHPADKAAQPPAADNKTDSKTRNPRS